MQGEENVYDIENIDRLLGENMLVLLLLEQWYNLLVVKYDLYYGLVLFPECVDGIYFFSNDAMYHS